MRLSKAFQLATVLLSPLLVSAAPLKRGGTDPDTLLVLRECFSAPLIRSFRGSGELM
jgi:hypothetical protein